MCIAILNKKSTTLKKELLKNCWENNYDGAGFMYTNGRSIVVHKELSSFDKYYQAYIDARRDFPESNIVLHFRISTHGEVNLTNGHPFLVNKKLGFVHNGIISGMGESRKFSDTYLFNRDILKPLPSGFESNKGILDVVEDAIGTYNKLIFLNSNNEFSIVNEAAGHWESGCWFSNTSYTYSAGYVDRGGYKVKSTKGYGWVEVGDTYKTELDYEPFQTSLTPEEAELQGFVSGFDLPDRHWLELFTKDKQDGAGNYKRYVSRGCGPRRSDGIVPYYYKDKKQEYLDDKARRELLSQKVFGY